MVPTFMYKSNAKKILTKFSQVAVLVIALTTGICTTAIVIPFVTPPAHAQSWIDRIQLTGAYVNVNGNPYYLGDYNETGAPVYPGVTWELRNNGRIIAKGYGRTPRAALWLIQKFFQTIPVS